MVTKLDMNFLKMVMRLNWENVVSNLIVEFISL